MRELDVAVDGVRRTVPAGSSAGDVLLQQGAEAVAARVNGKLVDLAHEVQPGDTLFPVTINSEDGRAILRHSTAHVLAQAVQQSFPDARLGMGPPIENGFYYDFDVSAPFHPDDLKRLEKRMRQIIRGNQVFRRRVVTEQEARGELATEPYKLQLLDVMHHPGVDEDDAAVEVGGDELTIYENVDTSTGEVRWKDLCRGPHLPSTAMIPAFKLLRSAAAYWRGRESNPQLQRIYGTAWESELELTRHLELLAEAEKRDHRRLGAELELFTFSPEVGSGLPIFLPKGGIIRRVMEDYSRERHEAAGYEFVYTPHISKATLFEISGHLKWFREAMYPPMKLEGAEYFLKPMNCPFHILVYRSAGRSYRNLPLRYFELGTVYRYEKSGVIHGVTRARALTQDDAHIFCAQGQLGDELRRVLEFVLELLRDFGLNDFYVELSTRPEGKAVGTDEEWDKATQALRDVTAEMGISVVLDEGGGAFYGPKVSFRARDAIGRTWQLSTIQLDFQLPRLFELEYQDADGSRQRPVMLHRALFGSIERFLGVLIEHYAGAFPPWLSPVQVVCIPVSDAQVPYLEALAGRLRSRRVRVEVDSSSERMQKKIRAAQAQKVPFMLIAGSDDVSADAVSFRYRDGTQKNGVPLEAAIAEIERAIADRAQI